MEILNASIVNFGSYRQLDFDFTNTGLCIIHGATGSGKSTVQDIVPWILHGITAKNGSVDEIRNWKAEKETTTGELNVKTNKDILTIVRKRGRTGENDLYWSDSKGDINRGKDLTDTQKLLDAELGFNGETYCLASCFNEFSDSGMFFSAKAKDRRLLFEKVANLDFANKLTNNLTLYKKKVKKEIEEVEKQKAKYIGNLEQLGNTKAKTQSYLNNWEKEKSDTLVELKVNHRFFEKKKQSTIEALETKSYRFSADSQKEIEDLIDKLDSLEQKIKSSDFFDIRITKIKEKMTTDCPVCGRKGLTDSRLEKLQEEKQKNIQYKDKFNEYCKDLMLIQKTKNPYLEQIEQAREQKNTYDKQIKSLENKTNPFLESLKDIEENEHLLSDALSKSESQLVDLKFKFDSLSHLYELSFELRAELLKQTVKTIEVNTNSYLEKYFDSEFKVEFELIQSDELDIKIHKNGYPCVYKQLSKGQRQLLKLTFSVSIMKAATNNMGVSFNLLTFDEAMDGLDVDLRIKAFSLFESLSADHSSVIVTDHTPEFKSLFSNSYKVYIQQDESFIEHE